MASSSKKRTTMAKLAREHKLRERRMEKQARRDARREAAGEPRFGDDLQAPAGPEEGPAVAEPAPDAKEAEA